jgi:hypothetical protein
MKRRYRIALVIAFATALGGGLLGACKQGEGERCQVNEDCEDGLTCSSATQTCEERATATPIDAVVPDAQPVDAAIDAMPPDAPPDAPDAAPDAEPDAAVDAMIDAA